MSDYLSVGPKENEPMAAMAQVIWTPPRPGHATARGGTDGGKCGGGQPCAAEGIYVVMAGLVKSSYITTDGNTQVDTKSLNPKPSAAPSAGLSIFLCELEHIYPHPKKAVVDEGCLLGQMAVREGE